ncbi:MAG: pilus assembly protein PilB, partial [Spartobacteria bacterium]
MDANQVVEIFVERGLLTEDQAAEFVRQTSSPDSPIEQILVSGGIVDERGFEQVIAESIGTEPYDLSEFQPDTSTLHLIPSGLARLHGCIPISASGNTIFVALTDPLNSRTLEDLRFALGREIVPVVSFPPTVKGLIREHYGSEDADFGAILGQIDGEVVVDEGTEDQFNEQAARNEANSAP